ERKPPVADHPIQRCLGIPEITVEARVHESGDGEPASRPGNGNPRSPGAMRANTDEHPAGPQSASRSLEGMDHAPQRDSSKRPAEERDVKGFAPFGQSLDRADAEVDVVHPASLLLPGGFIDAQRIRVEGQNRRGRACILQRQPPIATTDLENALTPEADKPFNKSPLKSVGWIGGKWRTIGHR